MKRPLQLCRQRRCSGQALTELAVMLSLLLFLLLGVEEAGRLAYTAIVVSDAAHAGALYGAQSDTTAVDDAGMVSAAESDGKEVSGLSATAAHVCTCADGSSDSSCTLSLCSSSHLELYVKVTTTASFSPIGGLLGWPSPLNLQGQAVLRAVQ